MTNTNTKTKTKTEIISKILSPALQLWLRSQVEHIEELEIKISGGNRDILRGYIPSVFLTTSRAIYQGLHLGQVEVKGENIKINLGQVMRGKPLRLLEPVFVSGKVLLEETHANASFTSPLLSGALTDLLVTLLEASGIANPIEILEAYQVSWEEVNLHIDRFILKGTLQDQQENLSPVVIRSGIALANSQTLRLHPFEIEAGLKFLNVSLNELEFDLGSEVEVEELSLLPGQLNCSGRLKILP
jgi:LmeA-like phospholipid-binding